MCVREVRPSWTLNREEGVHPRSSSNSSGSSKGSSGGNRRVSSDDDGWHRLTEEHACTPDSTCPRVPKRNQFGEAKASNASATRKQGSGEQSEESTPPHMGSPVTVQEGSRTTSPIPSPWLQQTQHAETDGHVHYRSRSNSVDSTCSRGSQHSHSTGASDCS